MSLELLDGEPREDDGRVAAYQPFLGTQRTGAFLPAGRWRVLCTQIGEYSPEVPYEGLWVFTCPERHDALEAWLDALDAQARSTDRGVDYSVALKLLAGGGSATRGGSPARLTPQQARAMSDSLTAAMLRDGKDWPFDDLRRWSAVWPVQP